MSNGPRIVINPRVFEKRDPRDAMCVMWNEALRIVMSLNGFEPASEPTEAQRKFFADTAYADDELQLRRTILARIATLDTSVKDPTDEQLEETAEMLEMVMEVGAPQNEWEQAAVKRLHDVVVKSLESTRANGSGTPAPRERGSARADLGGGATDDEKKPQNGDIRYVEKDGNYYRQTYRQGEAEATSGWNGEVMQKAEWDKARADADGGRQEGSAAPAPAATRESIDAQAERPDAALDDATGGARSAAAHADGAQRPSAEGRTPDVPPEQPAQAEAPPAATGMAGSALDVGGFTTGGLAGDGDRVRRLMEDAKGDRARRRQVKNMV